MDTELDRSVSRTLDKSLTKYLKDNLRIETIEKMNSYNRDRHISIKLSLNGEVISEDSITI